MSWSCSELCSWGPCSCFRETHSWRGRPVDHSWRGHVFHTKEGCCNCRNSGVWSNYLGPICDSWVGPHGGKCWGNRSCNWCGCVLFCQRDRFHGPWRCAELPVLPAQAEPSCSWTRATRPTIPWSSVVVLRSPPDYCSTVHIRGSTNTVTWAGFCIKRARVTPIKLVCRWLASVFGIECNYKQLK